MRKKLLELSLKVDKELQRVCGKLDLDDLQKDEIDEAVTAVFNKEMSASSNESERLDKKTNELRPNIDLVKVVNDVFEEEGFADGDNGTYRILALTCLQKLLDLQDNSNLVCTNIDHVNAHSTTGYCTICHAVCYIPKDGEKIKIVCDCDYYTSMILNGQKVCSNCEKIKAEAEKLIE